MDTIIASINIPDGSNRILSLKNIDFEKSVRYLKQEIGQHINVDFEEIEILHKGALLKDNEPLGASVEPNGYVMCFRKKKRFVLEPAKTPTEDEKRRVQELFSLTSHVQINVNSRVNILQKILQEYPEFRFNMGAHALIRDSVLFNTVHLPEVIENLSKHYPIICKAAPFIVDTIKKELKKSSASSNVSEPTTDTTSEDENSLGASSSSERNAPEANNGETARPNQVSRQQLQSALAFALGATNANLQSSAQRTPETASSSTTTTSTGNTTTTGNPETSEGITPTLFRAQLQRAMETMRQHTTMDMETDPPASTENETEAEAETGTANATPNSIQDTAAAADDTGDVIPAHYRGHQFAEQLRTMAQMGFLNYEENLTYLNITNGNIEHAVNLLMGIMN